MASISWFYQVQVRPPNMEISSLINDLLEKQPPPSLLMDEPSLPTSGLACTAQSKQEDVTVVQQHRQFPTPASSQCVVPP